MSAHALDSLRLAWQSVAGVLCLPVEPLRLPGSGPGRWSTLTEVMGLVGALGEHDAVEAATLAISDWVAAEREALRAFGGLRAAMVEVVEAAESSGYLVWTPCELDQWGLSAELLDLTGRREGMRVPLIEPGAGVLALEQVAEASLVATPDALRATLADALDWVAGSV